MTQQTKDDGGPAFPAEGGSDSGLYASPGMTLRDYFAAQALAGLCAAHTSDGQWSAAGLYVQSAEEAYLFADAMVAERSK